MEAERTTSLIPGLTVDTLAGRGYRSAAQLPPPPDLRSMWPELPLEFVVLGTAVSLQGSGRSREAWKDRVKSAAQAELPEGAWALVDRVAVTIYYFPEGEMLGDIDNIVKPILDAVSQFIYVDDQPVERVVVQKFEPERIFTFSEPSLKLITALGAEGPSVYIRLTDDPHEDLL